MRGAALLLGMAHAAASAGSRYVRNFSYVSEDFFSHWHLDTIADPTHGFVTYVDYETALREGLVNATADRVFMGADRKTVSATKGRKSVRIVSKAAYNKGLFIITMDHMPTGCGLWPALWMLGMNKDLVVWPTWGEYDIIEGVHRTSRSFTSLHTLRGCDQSSLVPGKDFDSKWGLGSTKKADNCDINAPGQWRNQGCSQEAPPASMGPAFNANKGGTYAAEWDPEAGFLRAWFWTAGSEPSDVAAGSPDPEGWGMPYSNFVFRPDSCPREKVQNMHIIYDLTFCGDLAGMMYRPMCPQFASKMTCQEHVGTNLEEMKDAYWSIRALDVYQREAEKPARVQESQKSPSGEAKKPPAKAEESPKAEKPARAEESQKPPSGGEAEKPQAKAEEPRKAEKPASAEESQKPPSGEAEKPPAKAEEPRKVLSGEAKKPPAKAEDSQKVLSSEAKKPPAKAEDSQKVLSGEAKKPSAKAEDSQKVLSGEAKKPPAKAEDSQKVLIGEAKKPLAKAEESRKAPSGGDDADRPAEKALREPREVPRSGGQEEPIDEPQEEPAEPQEKPQRTSERVVLLKKFAASSSAYASILNRSWLSISGAACLAAAACALVVTANSALRWRTRSARLASRSRCPAPYDALSSPAPSRFTEALAA